jgi:hypothetical protein
MRVKPNTPHHGHGLMGTPSRKAPLKAGAHVAQRVTSGFSDAKGYQGSDVRRNGAHKGKLPGLDTSKRSGAEGLSKGSAPPGVGRGAGVRGSLDSHLGDAGRGGPGKLGKSDAFTGKAKALSETLSHEWFEKLGAK